MISIILDFIKNHYEAVVSVAFLLVSCFVNIIQAIKTHNFVRLKDALKKLPEVIREVEEVSKGQKLNSLSKKAIAETICSVNFGSIYKKNMQLFSDAIEDILNTPQKKGGSVDVSKEN